MFIIGNVLLYGASIVALVCAILVIIKIFKNEGVGLGILSIFCGIFTYIWGWVKVKEYDVKKVMLIWTAMFIVSSIGYGMVMAGALEAAGGMEGLQQQIEAEMEQAIQEAERAAEEAGTAQPLPEPQ